MKRDQLGDEEYWDEWVLFGQESIAEGWRRLRCRVPDDCIDQRRYPLFLAREVMRSPIDLIKAKASGRSTPGCSGVGYWSAKR